MHLTRKRLSEREKTRVPDIGITSTPSRSLRILGVIVDCQLRWREQVNFLANKVKKLEIALKRITTLTYSSLVLVGKTLYRSIIRSTLAYSCEAWFLRDCLKEAIQCL